MYCLYNKSDVHIPWAVADSMDECIEEMYEYIREQGKDINEFYVLHDGDHYSIEDIREYYGYLLEEHGEGYVEGDQE